MGRYAVAACVAVVLAPVFIPAQGQAACGGGATLTEAQKARRAGAITVARQINTAEARLFPAAKR